MLKVILAGALMGLSFSVLAQTDSSQYFLQKGVEEKAKGNQGQNTEGRDQGDPLWA